MRAAVENGGERKREKQVVPRHRMPREVGVESCPHLFKTQTTCMYPYDTCQTDPANVLSDEQSLLGVKGKSIKRKTEVGNNYDHISDRREQRHV